MSTLPDRSPTTATGTTTLSSPIVIPRLSFPPCIQSRNNNNNNNASSRIQRIMSGSTSLVPNGLYMCTLVVLLHTYLVDASVTLFLYRWLTLSMISFGAFRSNRAVAKGIMCLLIPLPPLLYHIIWLDPADVHHSFIIFASVRESVSLVRVLYLDAVVFALTALLYRTHASTFAAAAAATLDETWGL
eukprot:PhM_4_TR7936/c1_g1_i1/m.97615